MPLSKPEIIAAVGDLITAPTEERRIEVTRTLVTTPDDAGKVILILAWAMTGYLAALDLESPLPDGRDSRAEFAKALMTNAERNWMWTL